MRKINTRTQTKNSQKLGNATMIGVPGMKGWNGYMQGTEEKDSSRISYTGKKDSEV